AGTGPPVPVMSTKPTFASSRIGGAGPPAPDRPAAGQEKTGEAAVEDGGGEGARSRPPGGGAAAPGPADPAPRVQGGGEGGGADGGVRLMADRRIRSGVEDRHVASARAAVIERAIRRVVRGHRRGHRVGDVPAVRRPGQQRDGAAYVADPLDAVPDA